MLIFFIVLSIISFIAFIVGIIGMIAEADPFGLFAGLFAGGLICAFIFSGSAAAVSAETEPAKQIEQVEQETSVDYNYCPYCGEALK